MSGFEAAIEHCTNEKRTDEDWGLILDICERVERSPNGPRESLRCIIKRLRHRIPHVAMSTLTLLDAMVKNCGKPLRREMSSRDFVAEAKTILNNKNTHPKVAQRFRFLIKKWAENEFKGDSELDLFVSGLYQQLVRDGAKFDYTEEGKSKDESRRKALVQEEEDIAKAIALSLDDGKKSRTATTKATAPSTTTPTAATTSTLYPAFSAPASSNEPAKEPRKVRALYDFEAVEDNELTFKAGEIILVSDDSDANWWKGSNHRGEGLFPATFVSTDLDAKPDGIEGASKAVSFNEEVSVVEELPSGSSASQEPITIDERCIDDCLAMLENADPTGEMKPDPPEMVPMELRCRQMAPLIDTELEKIDRRHNTLAEMNVKLMEALQLYNQLMASGPGPQVPMTMMGMKMDVPQSSMVTPPGQMVAPHPSSQMVPQMPPGPPPPQTQAPPPQNPMMFPPGMYIQPSPHGNQNNSNNAVLENQTPTQQNGIMQHTGPQQQPFFVSPPHPQFPSSMAPHTLPPQAPSQSPLL